MHSPSVHLFYASLFAAIQAFPIMFPVQLDMFRADERYCTDVVCQLSHIVKCQSLLDIWSMLCVSLSVSYRAQQRLHT